MDEQNFSYESYEALISAVKARSEIITFEESIEYKGKTPITFFRHDIDLCLSKALEMARFEHQHNVRSTYFIMTNNPLYSLEKSEDREIIINIEELGHKIGLHFDSHFYEQKNLGGGKELESYAKRELDYLAQHTSNYPNSISFHRPPKDKIGGKLWFGGAINAYSTQFMEFYISDSSRFWRCGCPIQAINSQNYTVGQVLTHPIWWNTKNILPKQCLQDLTTRLLNRYEMDTTTAHLLIKSTIPKVDFDK